MLLEKTVVKRFVKQNSMENLDKSFEIVFNDNKKSKESVKIGNEEPSFKIILNESLNKKELLKNPSVVLGEAYMDKIIEIDGDLYDALVQLWIYAKKQCLMKEC